MTQEMTAPAETRDLAHTELSRETALETTLETASLAEMAAEIERVTGMSALAFLHQFQASFTAEDGTGLRAGVRAHEPLS